MSWVQVPPETANFLQIKSSSGKLCRESLYIVACIKVHITLAKCTSKIKGVSLTLFGGGRVTSSVVEGGGVVSEVVMAATLSGTATAGSSRLVVRPASLNG